MSAAVHASSAWPVHRWVMVVLVIFTVQVGLLLALGSRVQPAPRLKPALAPLVFLSDPATERRLWSHEWISDPTLYVLVNERGFSGEAWLKMPALEHNFEEWSASPEWLGLPVNQLGGTFQHYVKTNTASAFPVVTKLAVPPTVPLPQAPLLTRSQLHVGGDLQGRALVSEPAIPVLPASDVLGASEVEVLVNENGDVFSARPVPPSGVRSVEQRGADQRALDLVRLLRFSPAKSGTKGLVSGTVTIRWSTIEPVAPLP